MFIRIQLYSTAIHKRLLLFLSVSGAGGLRPGTLVVAEDSKILVMEMTLSARYKTPRPIVTGGGK